MEKKNKKSIVIGITSLFLVTLILVGLTYAYYRTRIIGNDSTDPSISVVSKKLEVKYTDGNSTVNMEGLIEPGFEYTKTFTVENTGDDTVGYVLYLEDVVNEYTRTEDWTYEITCSPNCNGTDGYVEYPTLSEKLLDNEIASGVTQTYNVTIKYADSEDDQSDDMGATIEGKFNIYSPEYVVDIEGDVAGASEGDYVQINSVKKISKIVNGKYRLPAVEVGSHTLKVMSKTGTEKGSTTLTINKGTQGISGTTITMDDKSETVTLNITSIASSLGIEIKEISAGYTWNNAPVGSLLNAIKTNNKVTSPQTTPGKEASFVLETNGTIPVSGYSNYYWSYASDAYFDDGGPTWILSGINSCKYSECKDELVGKYLIYKTAKENSSSSSTDSKIPDTSGYCEIYQIESVSDTTINYKILNGCNPIEGIYGSEALLASTEDDYGTSYYFRGSVENNFVNFSGMCWRIVRIQGDGTIKIVLADEHGECNADTYSKDNTTSAFINNGTAYKYSEATGKIDDVIFEKSYYPDVLSEWMDKSVTRNGKTVKNLDRSKLVVSNWCNDTSINEDSDNWYWFGANDRTFTLGYSTSEPTLKCNMTGLNNSSAIKYSSEIGLLTADEVAFAGAVYYTLASATLDHYLKDNADNIWRTMTPAMLDYNNIYGSMFVSSGLGDLDWDGLVNTTSDEYAIRPAVVLSSKVTLDPTIITQDGTQANPYVIS